MASADQNLISRIRSRDKVAFKEFYSSHVQMLYGLAFCYVLDSHLAEEVLQEVFHSFLKAVFKGHDIVKPKHYLVKAVRNRAQYLKQKSKAYVSLDGGKDLPVAEPAREDFDCAEEYALLWRQVDRLPQAQREVICMYVTADMTFEEISSSVQAPLSTVLSRYHAALDRLRNAMGKNL
ncbi:RNA polymerase sigma factor [Planctomycetota bacterium]